MAFCVSYVQTCRILSCLLQLPSTSCWCRQGSCPWHSCWQVPLCWGQHVSTALTTCMHAFRWLVLAQRYSMRTFGLALAQALGKNCRKWYVQRNPCLQLITDPQLLRTMMCNIDLS